jgi:hypothetical protein
MTRTELNRALNALRDEKQALQEAKNRNYASSEDAFANLSLVERVTNGRVTTEQGIFIRALDKVSRLGNLLFDPEVRDEVGESIEDTWKDLSIYAELAVAHRRGPIAEPVMEAPQRSIMQALAARLAALKDAA